MSNKAIWYKSLDPAKKEKLLSHRAEWYKSLDPEEKEKLLSKSADWYKSLGSAEKQNLLSSRAIQYKSLDTAQKQREGKVHIIFALFVTEYYTEKLLNKQMYNTQQELFTELYTHDSFPS